MLYNRYLKFLGVLFYLFLFSFESHGQDRNGGVMDTLPFIDGGYYEKVLTPNGKSTNRLIISRTDFLNADSLKVNKNDLKIVSYTYDGYYQTGCLHTKYSNSNQILDQIKKYVKELPSNESCKIMLTNIIYSNFSGDKVVKRDGGAVITIN